MAHDIFISYRRKGGYETAKHLYDLLTRDGYKVSFDIDTLRSGDFDTELLKRIDECKDFIIVLNKGAFDRCLDSTVDMKQDWLRNELAYALQKGKNIIPLMLDGFTEFPHNLPNDIAKVSTKNGPKYDRYYFDDFYRRLKRDFLRPNKKSTWWKYLSIFCVLIIILIAFIRLKNCTSSKEDEPVFPDVSLGVDVTYKLRDSKDKTLMENELYALIEGQEYKINISEWLMCMEIVDQRDFDNDGMNDALVKNIEACGGNGALNSFFFVAYKGAGYFSISSEFGNCWDDPVIEKWNNQWSVIVESTNGEGYSNDKSITVRERYIFKDGKAIMVESLSKSSLSVLKEIVATEFSYDNPDEIKKILYDLDSDGKLDTIICSFWERWGEILWDVHFASGIITESNQGCDRIGILNSKTNGVNDLVCGEDYVFKWNGEDYVGKKK